MVNKNDHDVVEEFQRKVIGFIVCKVAKFFPVFLCKLRDLFWIIVDKCLNGAKDLKMLFRRFVFHFCRIHDVGIVPVIGVGKGKGFYMAVVAPKKFLDLTAYFTAVIVAVFSSIVFL